MNDLRTPMSRLRRVFRDARDRWRAKALERQKRLRNAKPEAVKVKVREPIPGDWQMLESSHEQEKVSANLAEWVIEIPAEGETVLTYRVRVRF